MNGQTYIYALVDPEDDCVFYIGKSDDPEKRLEAHKKDRRNKGKARRIAKIQRRGYDVILRIIEAVHEDEWPEREIHWIKYYRERNPKDMTNLHPGGSGGGLYRGGETVIDLVYERERDTWAYYIDDNNNETIRQRLTNLSRGDPGIAIREEIAENNFRKAVYELITTVGRFRYSGGNKG